MAYQGSLLPALSDTTFYDVGRIVALWVSAFEILVHPGEEGQANRDSVFALLESVAWQSKKCARKCFETGGRKKIKRTLASWLYQALNERRNDFLHGNPVTQEHLLLPGTDRSLFQYASPLYRMALTGFLPLIFDQPAPSSSDSSALAALIAERMDFLDPQLTFEEALMTAREPNRDPRSTTAPRRHPTSRAD